MADNTLIVCGGTGAHVALSFLRLHTLGASLGYFRRPDDKLFVFPEIFLVDQDAGDGAEAGPTAWQEVRRLIERHPGRLDRAMRLGRNEPPNLMEVRPLPLGRNNEWYRPPFDNLQARFAASPLLPALTAEKQRRIEYSKGMMGSPAVGSLLFKLKEYDERDRGVNNDERFGALLRNSGRIVVAGSGVGGTGAAVTPTLARRLAENGSNSVMAAILLSWFKFNENVADQLLRERAALKNKVLFQNGHSALEFCAQSLSAHVATVPIGMPDNALVLRDFTADFAQPVCESFALYVAALSAFRHFTSEKPYGHGLYAMGASERGRLDGKTPIPGGTLQDLVNRAATLVDLLKVWERVLAANQVERIVPSIYAAVRRVCDTPQQVAAALAEEREHYEAQLTAVTEVLRLKPEIESPLSFEQRSREWLGRSPLGAAANASPQQVALALFHWTADRLVETASPRNSLMVAPGLPRASHWPDLHREGIGISIKNNGDLEGVAEGNIPAVIQALVDRRLLSANGWPHPLAAADFFKHATLQRDPAAWRQLEILLVGVASGQLVVRPIGLAETGEPISLEALVKEYQRKEGYEGLAQLGIYLPQEGAAGRLLAFSSPFTLFAPVPYLDDAADNALWQGLWERFSGAASGEHWAIARQERWQEHQAVRLVRSWLVRERRNRGQEGPLWTSLFESYPAGAGEALVGTGASLKVYWRGSQLVDISLPSAAITDWIPQPGTPEQELEELRRTVPELAAWNGYEEIQFEMPGERDLVRGFWREHLQELQQAGKIFAFGQQASPARMVAIGTLVEGELRQTLLPNTLVLSRAVIAVQQVTPLEQRPIHGSGEGYRRFPDLPLRPEFIGLVSTPEGPLLELAKKGNGFKEYRSRGVESQDSSGRPIVSWTLQLRGRRDPMVIPISLEGEATSHAHWMVWPRFRSEDPAGWRAYYLYDFCRNTNLVCDTLWLEGTDQGGARLQLKVRQDPNRRIEALRFTSGRGGSAHSGGPPIALSLRNFRRADEPRGLYLIGLEKLSSSPAAINLGVDFGTSHSVVAFARAGDKEQKEVVELPAELDPVARNRSLSLHLSEDRLHLEEEDGLEERGDWMPNYRRKVTVMVPSELLLYRTLNQAQGDKVEAWQPLQHYTIPPLDLARPDMGELLISGFKWDASSSYFQGCEPVLREHYQSLLLELALADVVANRLHNIPKTRVGVTFCYPLRIQEHLVGAYKETITRVLQRTSASTGIDLQLFDGIGLLDESRAAATRRSAACEVCLVADLGGGTLDILIYGSDPELRNLDVVADSVRLGGNLLLREMLAAGAYLPQNAGWDETEGGGRMAKMMAWVRGRGAQGLWGVDADKPTFGQLGLSGFELPAQADPARRLITRYFNLIVEFLARNLTSYLFDVWYPGVDPASHSKLQLALQLRGNGWKLHYAKQSETSRSQAIQDMVKARVTGLWQEIPGNLFPLPTGWFEASYFPAEAKTAPAKGAANFAMDYETVRQNWHTRTLVELEVLKKSGVESIPWFGKVPFVTGGAKSIQMRKVAPAVPIDLVGDDRATVIHQLDAVREGEVNRALQDDGRIDGIRFFAPVAAEVWEALFRLPEFWPHRKGGNP